MARPGIQKHLDIAHLLRCPLCGEGLRARATSLACDAGHDFSVSAKGFANLIPRQAPLKGYDEEFFASRRRVMEAGCYRELDALIVDALKEHPLPASPVIVDAGCGEGSHLKAVHFALGGTCIGIDIAKDAVRCAARGGGPLCWLVGDVADIPLRESSADVILNVFTPANYAEFRRALKPDGLLVKVVPAPNHMRELRRLAEKGLAHVEARDHGVAEHLSRHMEVVSRRRVTQTSPIHPELATDLARMSPVTFGVDTGGLALDKLAHITVDAEIICARPNGQGIVRPM